MNDNPKPISNFALAKRIAALPPKVSPMQRLFLHTLLIHRNAKNGLCYPSHETIAKEMGASKATTKRNQRELVKLGYIMVDKVVTDAGKVNSYTLDLPDTLVSSSQTLVSSDEASVSSDTDLRVTVSPKQINKTGKPTDSNRVLTAPQHTQKGPIVVDEVIAVGNVVGISEDYCRKWWEGFEKAGWTTTRGVPVTRKNLRSLLVKWHENDERFRQAAAQKAASQIGAIHHQENYVNPLKKGNGK